MEEFTLLELEIDEVSFTNTSPLLGRRSAEDEDEDGTVGWDDGGPESGGHAARRLLLALVGLAVGVAIVRSLLGSEDEELEDLSVLDETDVEA